MTRWMFVFVLMGTGTALAQVPSSPISLAAKQIQYPQQHGTIDIEIGHTQLLKLDRQFKSIVIGNPKLVDVIVQDERTILINAKLPDDKEKPNDNTTHGSATNLILLDNANEPIYSAEVMVHGEQAPAITSLANVRVYGVSGSSGGSGNSGGSAGSGASGSSGGSGGSGASGGSGRQLADYVPFNCTARDCVRLNAERQNELSRGIYTTGVAHYDYNSNYTSQSNSPSTPPPNAPGS
jgi:uncharacterized membrane protein YgcG